MTHIVRNREDLIARGRTDSERKARKDLLDVAEATIRAVDPYGLVKDAMRLSGRSSTFRRSPAAAWAKRSPSMLRAIRSPTRLDSKEPGR